MPNMKASTPRNLSALLVGAIACEFLWSWFNFSGPFRKLVDLQLGWSGTYSETLTAIALGLVAAVGAGIAVVVLERLLPHPPAVAIDVLVALVLLAVTCGMLVEAKQLWREADSLPTVQDPVREVDLGALGDADPPTGHVRLLGTPVRDRTVTMRSHNRAASRLDVYAPMSDGRPVAAAAPVRLLVSTGGANDTALAHPIPSNPQGVLLAGALDTRTIYELRAAGLPVADHPFVLFWPGRDVDDDARIEALLLGVPALLFWPFALADWWRRRRAPGAVPEPVTPAIEASGAPPYVGYGTPDDPWNWRRDTSLAGLGFGVSVVLLMALWEWGDLLPGFLEVLGYKAAGVLLIVSLVVDLLPSRRANSPMINGSSSSPPSPRPQPATEPADTAWLVLMRDALVSDNVYLRADVDGQQAAILKSRRYAVVALRPGAHTLSVNARYSLVRDSRMAFDAAAGEILVFRVWPPFLDRPFAERVPVIDAWVALGKLTSVTPSVPLPTGRTSAAPEATTEESIRQAASRHLAAVLGVPEASLARMPFPKSPLVDRQFEVIQRELLEVGDEQLRREMQFGTLLLTLHMYCVQMARCHAMDPGKVERVLGMTATP